MHIDEELDDGDTMTTVVEKSWSIIWTLTGSDVTLLTLLHSERPKLYRVLAILSAVGLNVNIWDTAL